MPIPAMQMLAASGNVQWFSSWKAAYDRQAAGGGQAHIVTVGDSITQGFYSATPYYANGWAGVNATRLAARTGVTPGTGLIPLYEEDQGIVDARTSRTGTWALSTAGSLYSKLPFGESGDTFTLGPITCSAFRVVYITTAGGGSWTYSVDGGSAVAQTSLGTNGVHVLDIDAGGAGSHTLVLTATGKMFVSCIEAISNPTSGVKVSRLAYSGKMVSDLTVDASTISSRQVLLQSDPDLAIIEFGLNEASNGVSTAMFQANLESLVNDFHSLGASVLILIAPPPNTSFISNWADYRTVMLNVADAKNCGVVDMVNKWGTYTGNIAYYSDNVHPNAAGHADVARIVADYVVETVSPSVPSATVPSDIANLALWLDASDPATFSYSSGTLVSAWNDKSGNNRHFTQVTAGNQPSRKGTVNGLGAVVFDGVDDWLTGGDVLDLGTSNISIFSVVRFTDPTENGSILGKYKVTPSDGEWFLHLNTSKISTVFDPGTVNTTVSGAFASVDTQIIGTIIDRVAGTVTQRIRSATNGTNTFTPDSASNRNTTHSSYIGALRNVTDNGFQALYFLDGYVCEIVVYLGALGSSDRTAIEAYLTDKWNLL